MTGENGIRFIDKKHSSSCPASLDPEDFHGFAWFAFYVFNHRVTDVLKEGIGHRF